MRFFIVFMNSKIVKILLLIIFVFSSGIAAYFLFLPQPEVKGDFATYPSARLVFTFFDVGQGDSGLIRTPQGQDVLIDGGPDNKVVQKLGQAMPLMDRDIELMILSHPHSDHVTGLNEVIRRYNVKKIMMTGLIHTAPEYRQFLKLIEEKNIKVEIIKQPEEIAIEAGLSIKIFFPDENLEGRQLNNVNNSSIVSKIIFASTSFMLTGDYEDEESLAEHYKTELKSDVLKVGHHGSVNANNEYFLKLVNPLYAVISVGANNRYGHPQYRVLHELESLGAKILRTDQDGDIIFVSDGRKIENMQQ